MIDILIKILNFVTNQLNAEAAKLEEQAKIKTVQINQLIAERMNHFDVASKARAIAENVRKFTEV